MNIFWGRQASWYHAVYCARFLSVLHQGMMNFLVCLSSNKISWAVRNVGCKGLTDHFLKKAKSTLIHSLMQSFRRHRELRSQLRLLRGQLRQRRYGITPDSEGDEGQKTLPRHF